MDGLEQSYSGRMEFIRYDLTSQEGWCEFQRLEDAGAFASTQIPLMLYYDGDGNLVEVTNGLQSEEVLREKFDNLLATG